MKKYEGYDNIINKDTVGLNKKSSIINPPKLNLNPLNDNVSNPQKIF